MAIFLTLGERRVLVTMLIVFLDMSTLVTARQKLESQQQENKGVQKVRKLIPPEDLRLYRTNGVLGVQLACR